MPNQRRNAMTRAQRSARIRPFVLSAIVTVLGLSLVPLTANPAMACSCADATDKQQARRADAVFVGRVDEAPIGGTSATFVVDEVYKGDVPTYVYVVTATGDCGLAFVRGQTMAVFARYGDGGDTVIETEAGQLVASLCDGRALDAAPLKLTGGHAPVAMDSDSDGDGFPVLGWLSLLAVTALGLLPVALWMRFRSQMYEPDPGPPTP